jgi:hypothetical protein
VHPATARGRVLHRMRASDRAEKRWVSLPELSESSRPAQPVVQRGSATVANMPRPTRFDPSRLPGAILLPTYWAYCDSCEESTTHAGLGDEEGREMGSHCVWCGTKAPTRDWRDDPAERATFEAEAECTGLMQIQPDLLARASGE